MGARPDQWPDDRVRRSSRRRPLRDHVHADGAVWYASLAGNHIARVDPANGQATVFEPPTPNQGARRIWADSHGRLWVSEWNAGQVAVFDPAAGKWREWRLPGDGPQAYAVYVDDRDEVWLSDFGANALVRFDPATESFTTWALPDKPGNIRQLLGRPGEVWAPSLPLTALLRLRTPALGGTELTRRSLGRPREPLLVRR